jgi:hypothetical protein
MPCYHPIDGFMTLSDGFVMSRRHPQITNPMTISCGQCIGCRLERSRQWAIRCVHEQQMHEESCFITLTYNDENLPYGNSLNRPDFQKFMKRLIKKTHPIRLFYCGEYGDETLRPHYHAILFGFRPTDGIIYKTDGEITSYTSKLLTQTWGLGFATFGEATFESASYCASYTRKKINGPKAAEHYSSTDPETGEIIQRVPEFGGQSRRPGIGTPWLNLYGADAYAKDQLILRNMPMRPPRAYDKLFENTDPLAWQTIKLARAAAAAKRARPLKRKIGKHGIKSSGADPTAQPHRRLIAGEKIAKQKLQQRKLQ